jgi:hypothetical protein
MAGIDYTIPGQFKGIQLESPMNAMAQAMQLRNLQETSQMNALKTQEYQRAREEENALRKLFASGLTPESPEFRNMLYSKAPGLAPTIEKNILERGKAAAEIEYKQAQGRKEAGEALEKNLIPFRSNAAAVTTPEQAAAHTEAIYAHPVLGPWANKVMPKDKAVAQSRDLFTNDPQRWMLAQTGVSGDKIVEITQKQEELRRKENDAAYADYVYQTKMANPDAPVVSKADFLAQRNQPANAAVTPTPVNATAVTPTPVNAAFTNVTPSTQISPEIIANNENKEFPPATYVANNSIDPLAAELYRTSDPKYKPIADALQAAHIERIKRGQLTGEFANVQLAQKRIDELKKIANPTKENLVEINNLLGLINAAKEGRGTNVRVNVPVSVSTEKKFGEAFAGKVADADVALRDAAERAPDTANTANRILGLLSSGQIITGAGANVKLQLAKLLKLGGGNDTEAVTNTEVLISSLAESTLGAIKSSGLGSGQGFTDKDREFLERAKSGQITYEASSLKYLAELAHKASAATANKWNKRVKQIPKSAIEGTGIDTTPVEVAPVYRQTGGDKNAVDVMVDGKLKRFKNKEALDAYKAAGGKVD